MGIISGFWGAYFTMFNSVVVRTSYTWFRCFLNMGIFTLGAGYFIGAWIHFTGLTSWYVYITFLALVRSYSKICRKVIIFCTGITDVYVVSRVYLTLTNLTTTYQVFAFQTLSIICGFFVSIQASHACCMVTTSRAIWHPTSTSFTLFSIEN